MRLNIRVMWAGIAIIEYHPDAITNTNNLSYHSLQLLLAYSYLKIKFPLISSTGASSSKVLQLYRLSMGCHIVSPAPVWVRITGP